MFFQQRTFLNSGGHVASFAAALLLAAAMGLSALQDTSARSDGDKICTDTPTTCQYNYNGSYHYYEVTKSGCTDCSSTWAAHLSGAKSSWSNAAGPQYFVDAGGTPAGYTYTSLWLYEYPPNSDPNGLIPGYLAYTYPVDYNTGQYCTNAANACRVWYANIYFNQTKMNNPDPGYDVNFVRQYAFAHEFGHVQGLAHFNTTTALMYANYATPYNGPGTNDIGTNAPCHEGRGNATTIRCIYNWSN